MNRDKIFEECICELGKRVNLEWNTIDDALNFQAEKGEDWYRKMEWSKEEESNYRSWLEKKVRKQFRGFTKRSVDFEVGMFMLNYGWKVKE
jgi:hypothetical protein